MNQLSQETRHAIAECWHCHSVCLALAMTEGLEKGGPNVRPQHFRLMEDCARISAMAADMLSYKSQFHRQMCALCAEACEACARDCEPLQEMAECVTACRSCAQACLRLT